MPSQSHFQKHGSLAPENGRLVSLEAGSAAQDDQITPLIPHGTSESSFNIYDCDSTSHKIHFEACRRSLDFQMEQYLRYSSRVRDAGFDPKRLLEGLEIVDSGPNKPPPDFWCLINVRDRLISQSNVLCDYFKRDSEEARQLLQSSLRISAPLSCLSLIGSVAVFDRNVLPTVVKVGVSLSPLIYSVARGSKVIAAERSKNILQAIIQRATNWDLDEVDRGRLKTLESWLWLLH